MFVLAGVVWCCWYSCYDHGSHGRLDAFWGNLGEMFFSFSCGLPWGIVRRVWSELKWIQSTKRTINQKTVTKTSQAKGVFTCLYVTSGSFLFANTTVFGIAKWMTMKSSFSTFCQSISEKGIAGVRRYSHFLESTWRAPSQQNPWDVSTVWVKNLQELWVKKNDPNATWCSPSLMGDRGKIQEEKHVRKKTPFYYVAGFMDVDGM